MSHICYYILYGKFPSEEIKESEMQTVTFGINCAPYLAICTLLQLSDYVKHEYPLAPHM